MEGKGGNPRGRKGEEEGGRGGREGGGREKERDKLGIPESLCSFDFLVGGEECEGGFEVGHSHFFPFFLSCLLVSGFGRFRLYNWTFWMFLYDMYLSYGFYGYAGREVRKVFSLSAWCRMRLLAGAAGRV